VEQTALCGQFEMSVGPWLLYAGNRLAPLRRRRTGAYTPETRWLL